MSTHPIMFTVFCDFFLKIKTTHRRWSLSLPVNTVNFCQGSSMLEIMAKSITPSVAYNRAANLIGTPTFMHVKSMLNRVWFMAIPCLFSILLRHSLDLALKPPTKTENAFYPYLKAYLRIERSVTCCSC